jgi:ABC-type Fe3+-hydroxamate transport system substrate-binding protein
MWIGAGSDEVTTIFEISSRPGYSETDAVQTDRVYHYDSSMLKRPGPRQVTAILKLAHLLHPYYFDNPEDSVSPWELGRIDELYPPPVPLD